MIRCFAVGGMFSGEVADSGTTTWIIIAVAVIGIIVAAFLFIRLRNSGQLT